MQNDTFMILISLRGTQEYSSVFNHKHPHPPRPNIVKQQHAVLATDKRDRFIINHSLSSVNLGLNMNLGFLLFRLEGKFTSSNLQFIPTASTNDKPTVRDHRDNNSFFRSQHKLINTDHKKGECRFFKSMVPVTAAFTFNS